MCVVGVISSGFVMCFKQKTADEMRIRYWSSDVCASDRHHLGKERRTFIPRLCSPRRKCLLRCLHCAVETIAVHVADRREDFARDRIDYGQRLGGPYPHATHYVRKASRNSRRSEERRVGKECVSTCRARG